MQIISIDTGRVTWLFPTEEFVPLGGANGIDIIHKVADRYQFKHFPDKPTAEEVNKNGLKFATGVFETKDATFSIGEFALYNDGIVAVTNTTERATAFLEDIVEYAIKEFNFRRPISAVKKIFMSIVTVEFDYAAVNLFARHAALASLIAEYLNAPQGTAHDIAVTRVEFSLDDPVAAPNARPKLILESRVSVPLARRRYISNAATHTNDHLELLRKLEETFLRPSGAGI